KNLRAGNIKSDPCYDAIFLPAVELMKSLESRGQCPDLGPHILRSIEVQKGPIDLSELNHPDWRVTRYQVQASGPADQRGCETTSISAGSPFLTTASAREIAGPMSLGLSIGPSL